jgi:hypothetical protein
MLVSHPQEIRLLIKTIREFCEKEVKPLSMELDRMGHQEVLEVTREIIN